MKENKKINVMYHGRKVGTIALHQGRFGAFAYDREWLSDGFSISPFSLPLESRVFIPKICWLLLKTLAWIRKKRNVLQNRYGNAWSTVWENISGRINNEINRFCLDLNLTSGRIIYLQTDPPGKAVL